MALETLRLAQQKDSFDLICVSPPYPRRCDETASQLSIELQFAQAGMTDIHQPLNLPVFGSHKASVHQEHRKLVTVHPGEKIRATGAVRIPHDA
jgi:hypothetical protein